MFVLAVITLSLTSVILPAWSAGAQSNTAPCGYVDRFDLPISGIDFEHTDFGIYRGEFGGLHTGMDVAFERLGDPVKAAARGQVTYSDPQGWGTEKGVVVIQHTMPDGTQVNSLYGHMEELNGHTFPAVNQCVERGDVVGAVGFPSLGRPHLHYEIRTRYRYEGGPGYTTNNPLEIGWFNPLDFTFLANIWVLPAYRGHFSLTDRPILPPLPLADGSYVIAHGNYLEGITAAGENVWQFDTDGSTTGLLALPDGRVLAATSSNQVLVLNNGSYSAFWQVPDVRSEPMLAGSAVIFMTENNTLAAFTPDGSPLWQTSPLDGKLARWAINGTRLAASTENHQLTIVDEKGSILYQAASPDPVIPFSGPDGGFLLLQGSSVVQIDQALAVKPLFDTGRPILPGAELLSGAAGTFYLYSGEGRSLYAYAADGSLTWIAYMPGSFLRAPLLGLGGGRLIYVVTADGQFLAHDATDGHLVAQLTLYNGGADGVAAARWLKVQPDDTVSFSSGYLSTVTINGLDLLAALPAN